jgi:hypothetical protein
MLELSISTHRDLKQAPSDRCSPAATGQIGSRTNRGVSPVLGKVGAVGLSPAASLGSILRGVVILPILLAGLALLLSGLVPALFIGLILLLVGLAPILLVGLGILLTARIELPSDSLKRRGYVPE